MLAGLGPPIDVVRVGERKRVGAVERTGTGLWAEPLIKEDDDDGAGLACLALPCPAQVEDGERNVRHRQAQPRCLRRPITIEDCPHPKVPRTK
jgi:hypothetical protein